MPRLDPERAARLAAAAGPARSTLTPTDEQTAILAAYESGSDLVIEAGAGTGKTSTLRLLAQADESRHGIYIAYNRAIADDAKGSFPLSVRCATAHSLAFREVGVRYQHRLNGPRVPAYQAARMLDIHDVAYLEMQPNPLPLAPATLARLAQETVERFCWSDSEQLEATHVPYPEGLPWPAYAALQAMILPIAQKVWADLTALTGHLKFTHDCYLKLWQLSHPKLPADFVLLDEAQDANPVIDAIFREQVHAQRIMVGDQNQAIYRWRGAIDAMARFEGQRLQLSQSFRFGPVIAAEANKWLSLLGSSLYLRGREDLDSRLETGMPADAVLCRSNAGAVARVIEAKLMGRKVALVGGGNDIRQLALAANDLLAGRGTQHPELFLFRTWQEVCTYADESGTDLKTFVKLINGYGPETVLQALEDLAEEKDADLIVSTAHKAKGREWASVRIADDFYPPSTVEELREDEARLAYVAVTRAKLILDREGLAWVDRFLQ